MNALLIIASALLTPQDPTKAALDWLAKAEKALIDAPILELSVERKSTVCIEPEIHIRRARAKVVMASGSRLRVDCEDTGKSEHDENVNTYIRCDGTTLGFAEGTGVDKITESKRRAMPTRHAENAAAVIIRAGVEVDYLGWPVVTFEGTEPIPDTFKVENAKVVQVAKLGDRPAVELAYDLICFGKRYQHELWLDRETLAPLKRKCREAGHSPHARIVSYEETYSTLKKDVKPAEDCFAVPASWGRTK